MHWIDADFHRYKDNRRKTWLDEQVMKAYHNFNFEYFGYKLGSKWEILRKQWDVQANMG